MEPFISFLPLIVLLLPLTSILPQSSEAYSYCEPDNKFTDNSTYQSNLQLLLRDLPDRVSSAIPSGFKSFTIGSPPNRVYGLALCRGDLSSQDCNTCLKPLASGAEQSCPHAKSARIFQDGCLLRYSKLNFNNTIDKDTICLNWGANMVGSSENARFNASLRAMLGKLRKHAVLNTTSPRLFAMGEIGFGGTYYKINGMVQCTRDISANQCDQCLEKINEDLSVRCYGQRYGVRAVTGTCIARCEIYEFFDRTQPRLKIPALTEVSPGNFQWASSPPPMALPPAGDEDGGHQNPRGNNKKVMILALAISFGVIFFALNLIGWIYLSRRKEAPASTRSNSDGMMQKTSTYESLSFNLDLIKKATDNFSPSNKLGEGGFGSVYKGKLLDGRYIAVKRLSKSSSQGIEELNNEMSLLTRLQHRNLTRILGACVECGEKLLIYEFIENKSLDSYLSDHVKKLLLNWEVRCKIIRGIARGMFYLHEESQLKIIHRDIKASNILLDGEMNPKICDFGVARLFDEKQTHARTKKVVGTFGYMPPEYVIEGKYSIKSDIYSFGVLILEVITGIKNYESPEENAEDLFILRNYVWDHWLRKSSTTIVDASMEGNFPHNEALKFIHIGLLCVQDNPKDRPTMEEVELMLGNESISIPAPQRPLSISQTTFNEKRSPAYSPNNVSISEFIPR